MSILSQHGYGKTNKVEEGIRNGYLGGVILSPRDEKPDNLISFIEQMRTEFENEVQILFDPQFYLTTVDPLQEGKLPQYSFFRPNLVYRDFLGRNDIRDYVRATLDYQAGLNLDRIISPNILCYDFTDRWSHISLLMAQEAIDYHAGLNEAPPLLLSLIIDEGAFNNKTGLDELLDTISVWPVAGYYLIVNVNDAGYPAFIDANVLSNVMYLINVLGDVHGHEIQCGYSDLVGLLYHAAGATATATGWHTKLKQFSISRFQPSTGGRRARERYTSRPLLNSILKQPELETIFQLGMIDSALSNTAYDTQFARSNPGNIPWPYHISCMHHWETLSNLCERIAHDASVTSRLNILQSLIKEAIENYNNLQTNGVLFDVPSGVRNLRAWAQAIEDLKEDIKI